MIERNYLQALAPLVRVFATLGIRYHIAGSVASSLHGVARTTLDADVVADMSFRHVAPLIEALQAEYYVDGEMVADAARHRASFNIIHLASMMKLDVFILKTDRFDRQAFERAEIVPFSEQDADARFLVESAEDVVLNKLRWYRLGGGVSERQWSDVIGVLRVKRPSLDLAYLRRWAAELRVLDLLEQALTEAGV